VPTAQRSDFVVDRPTLAQLHEFPSDSQEQDGNGLNTQRPVTLRRYAVGLLQVMATIYAVAIFVVTVRMYTGNEQQPGLTLFFVACMASLYIIFYNVLSIQPALACWLRSHLHSFRALTVSAAVLVAAIPIGLLYSVQPVKALFTNLTRTVIRPSRMPSADPQPTEPSALAEVSPSVLVTDVGYWSEQGSTMVAIDLNAQAQYEVHRVGWPERIYIDVRESSLNPALLQKQLQIKDPLLRRIRFADHEDHRTRITLETSTICDYFLKPVPKSHRILIELRNSLGQS